MIGVNFFGEKVHMNRRGIGRRMVHDADRVLTNYLTCRIYQKVDRINQFCFANEASYQIRLKSPPAEFLRHSSLD
jgi:hypothetical protein